MDFIELLASFFAVAIVLTMHEFSHAFVAYKCGDPTPKHSGRLTLNPMRHFDPLGLVLFAFAGFGWAKPVPVNPYNFKNKRWGEFWTSIAGVLTNFLFALLIFPICVLVLDWAWSATPQTLGHTFLVDFFTSLFLYSITFCAFNLFPLYPLDGFRALEAMDKKHGKIYWFLRRNGQYILLGLIAWSFVCNSLLSRTGMSLFYYSNVLQRVMDYATKFLTKPIDWIWKLVL